MNVHLGILPRSCGSTAHLQVKSEYLTVVPDSRKKKVRSNQNISYSDLCIKNWNMNQVPISVLFKLKLKLYINNIPKEK